MTCQLNVTGDLWLDTCECVYGSKQVHGYTHLETRTNTQIIHILHETMETITGELGEGLC